MLSEVTCIEDSPAISGNLPLLSCLILCCFLGSFSFPDYPEGFFYQVIDGTAVVQEGQSAGEIGMSTFCINTEH